jgi:HD-GYP domain-containing protein (c-di-GMP phosphodiesterase class II)
MEIASRQAQSIWYGDAPPLGAHASLPAILAVTRSLREFKSVDAILDKVLLEARRLVRADAGSIFLVEGDALAFSNVHNDSLFSEMDAAQNVYRNASIPIDDHSLAGHAARRNRPVVVDDAYSLEGKQSLQFNQSFDLRAGYRTRAVACLPIVSSQNRVLAVMQIINPQTPTGQPAIFDAADIASLALLADQAAAAVETGLVTEDFILRMASLAQLRDPHETGAHVKRVGAYAAEIYHALSLSLDLSNHERKRRKSMMRVAAMLHDVGKVAISDAILKKPGRLTEVEFETMKSHTVLGAMLFRNPASEVDAWTRDAVLHHHQHYDGRGYPGRNSALAAGENCETWPLAGEDIPLPARITAVADVYDALMSHRIYKPPIVESRVFDMLREQRGRQFDPVILDAFFSIYDIILAIRQRYPDEE